MDLEIVPFDDRFAGQAAQLIAGDHASTGTDLADADAARRLVAEWQGDGPAVAAVAQGELVGFMAASAPAFPGHQLARIRLQQHASVPEGKREIYRRLYGALSEQLTAVGAFEHSVMVAAAHQPVITCLFELGFGIDQVKGIRQAAPIGAAGTTEVREAGAEDLSELLDLTVELQRFHAAPPILRPALLDLRAIRDDLRTSLVDPDRVVLVAAEHERLIGMIQAGRDNRFPDTATIGLAVVTAGARSGGVGTALLSGVLGWASRCGFRSCGTEWSSANLVSDAFWRDHGFSPARYTLTRLIDARVAWAHTRLSYRYFSGP
ncbi:GNAT family N-acetyltransferase [Saccharopolyspora sp. NPDC050389]|uniref:GNAT family N-acetyltransferase n=1 Tax=Saccharopolyspora sp. NPDC050389 TaxID=3155516 RepID=UPI0033EEFC75